MASTFLLRQRLRNFAGLVEEKLRDRAEHAVVQGDNPVPVRL